MGFLDLIFGKSKEEEPLGLNFGRYSDNYKSQDRYDAWDKAVELYEKKDYLESFTLFLDYLLDPVHENVNYKREGDEINFEIYQGSKKVTGFVNKEKFFAEAKIAKSKTLDIGFLRRLLEQNFELKYSSYALDESEQLTMVYDSFAYDSSPFKNYYALKELATSADKQDDILIDEFESLEAINTGHVTEISSKIKNSKYLYLKNKIEAAIKEVNEGKLNIDQYPGGISYLLLDLVYKCDYLLKPEGHTMNAFEQIHKEYFSKEDKSSQYKNREIIKALKKLLERSEAEFATELYEVKSTFGITVPSSHEQLVGFIDGELGNMEWYESNKHPIIAQSIPGYIIGYSFFNYAVPALDKELMHFYYEIVEHDFMKSISPNETFVVASKLNRSEIIKRIKTITKKYVSVYPNMSAAYDQIDFKDILSFSKTYLLFIRNLNLTKAKNLNG